jgi:hypothetical protein
MLRPLALALVLVAGLRGCIVYEYEHEFWLDTDGSGTVYVTGRPELWETFKGLQGLVDAPPQEQKEMARRLFESAGLEVNRVTVTHRGGRPYLFISADFSDLSALAGNRAFPDLLVSQRAEGDSLRLSGTWRRPAGAFRSVSNSEGLMAIRFHLPSKVYEHQNASDGIERGNILGWRQPLSAALSGSPLEFGARSDRRSILLSTVGLFGGAIVLALATLSLVFVWVVRKGRRELATGASTDG